MTRTKKIDAVMNEMARRGYDWTIELQDEAERVISICDGKDTARQIAQRVVDAVAA